MVVYVGGAYQGSYADKTLMEHNGASVFVRHNPDYKYDPKLEDLAQ